MVELLPSNNFPITLPLHSTPLHSVHKKSQRPLLRALDCCQRQPATRGGGEEGRSEGAFPNCAVSFLQHVHRSDSDRPTGSNFKARARGKEDGMYEFGRSISTRFQRYSQVLSILQLHVLALSRRAQSSHALSIPWHAMSMSLGMPSPSGISSASPECGKLIILSPLK